MPAKSLTVVAVGALLALLRGAASPLLGAPPAAASAVPTDASGCAAGVVKDDGDPETGYGFVPSAVEGIYVQRFRAEEFPSRWLSKVCVCLMKTRGESDADFEVVFYEDAGGRPAATPFASVAAHATDLPRSKEAAGRFYDVDVSVEVPAGAFYVGARWDPSAARFMFVCTDTSAGTGKAPVFFREDRSRGWASVFQARDPIFRPHRSILVRAVSSPEKPRFVAPAASSTPAIRSPTKER